MRTDGLVVAVDQVADGFDHAVLQEGWQAAEGLARVLRPLGTVRLCLEQARRPSRLPQALPGWKPLAKPATIPPNLIDS